jgi:hypothetical protein
MTIFNVKVTSSYEYESVLKAHFDSNLHEGTYEPSPF